MNITENKARIGNFTSSEIFALTTKGKIEGSFGKPALTYIDECNMERRLGRSLNDESNARPLIWGKFLESRAFELLGLEYILSSDETIVHPEISFWSGSKDGEKLDEGKTVIDIKCPITLKSFCQIVDCKTIEEVRENHRDGEKYYWQLVSNAILTKSKYAELIVYLPYRSELNAIREMASNFDGDQNKIAWIGFAEDNELPYLIDGGHYKNLNIIRFEVPESDKKFLTERVIKAGDFLQTI